MSRADLARESGVSVRLVAEFERGERPNISLETALRLLDLVGLSLSTKTHGRSGARRAAIGPRATARAERDERGDRAGSMTRAEMRRRSWTAGRSSRSGLDSEPVTPSAGAERIRAVAEASILAYAIAEAGERGRQRPSARSRKK
jgi:transcriptional regulator with XRE-family HTH domain